MEKTGCCEPFDPRPWRDAIVTWKDKPFLAADVRALFHIPFGIGRVAARASDAIKAAHAEPREQLMLAEGSSPWKTHLLIATKSEIPGWRTEKVSGTFFTKVFDGPWKDTPKWHEETLREAERRGFDVDGMYESWTTCPKCAKAYGHNYVVLMARIHGAEKRAAA